MSPIFEMRPAIAYHALRREKSFDLDAIIANNLNLPLSTLEREMQKISAMQVILNN